MIDNEKQKNIKEVIKQFIKFGIIGVSNTCISLAIYYILVWFNCNYIIANIIGFLVSTLNAYYWNNKYVFKNTTKNKFKVIIKVYISYGVTFIMSTCLLYVFVDVLKISKYIAPLINLCITVPLNFIVNKLWAFKQK